MLRLLFNAYHVWLSSVYMKEYYNTEVGNTDLKISLRMAAERHAKKVG